MVALVILIQEIYKIQQQIQQPLDLDFGTVGSRILGVFFIHVILCVSSKLVAFLVTNLTKLSSLCVFFVLQDYPPFLLQKEKSMFVLGCETERVVRRNPIQKFNNYLPKK